ncbi:MAG TPA: alkaline phosphatase family protein, partial [Mycobacteriales bacterium]|nr:alkaline phosphatase family protein [Mycobacteriales bacterium]
YRYQIWKQDFEKNGPADLNMFWLSSDHTGGPPSPEAQVADNDLATGKIVDEISHSKYWKDSAIFVVEDDSQAGLDHVDGHRAPIQIISPYSKHGVVDNRYYSQITMIRTIEQILGIHPMNQKDSAATPMTTAFNKTPNLKPFNAVANRTSLTLGLSTQPSCGSDVVAAKYAQPSTAVPAQEKQVAAQWQEWSTHQRLTGKNATADYANPEQMNHYTWYQVHGWKTPYPGESKIYSPNQVPGAYIPSSDSDE